MVTINFNNVYLKDFFSIAGPDEYNGNIKNANMYMKDLYYGEKILENAEIKMQKVVLNNLIKNNNFELVIGSDLSNQLGITNMVMKNYKVSYLGVYNACSSYIESMIIGSNMISNNSLNDCLCITSSHVLTSERQFRFPNEYGSIKKSYRTTTITASVGCILSNTKTNIKIKSGTIGNVVDYGITDVANMGAVMAPSSASVLNAHLYNTKTSIDDYDLILTGDLGSLGNKLLTDVLKQEYGIIANKIIDAGTLVYKNNQDKGLGASGPTVLPFVLFNKILQTKKYKRILLIGSGALHNPTLINQKNTIPSISHALELEVTYDR